MIEFIRVNFDKLLLSGLVVTFVTVILYCLHRPALDTAATVAFSQDMAKLFAGALLTLITGRVLAKTNGDTHATTTSTTSSTTATDTSH